MVMWLIHHTSVAAHTFKVYIIEELKYLKLGPNFVTVYEEIDEHTGR